MASLIKLRTSDGELFFAEEATLMQSQTLKRMIDDGFDRDEIPLHNVDCETLIKALEWCRRHEKEGAEDEGDELKLWENNFVQSLDTDALYYLMMAANYLEINGLLDRLTRQVADMIKGKTIEEIRRRFHIENDFSPEEEKKIREEHAWAFT